MPTFFWLWVYGLPFLFVMLFTILSSLCRVLRWGRSNTLMVSFIGIKVISTISSLHIELIG